MTSYKTGRFKQMQCSAGEIGGSSCLEFVTLLSNLRSKFKQRFLVMQATIAIPATTSWMLPRRLLGWWSPCWPRCCPRGSSWPGADPGAAVGPGAGRPQAVSDGAGRPQAVRMQASSQQRHQGTVKTGRFQDTQSQSVLRCIFVRMSHYLHEWFP